MARKKRKTYTQIVIDAAEEIASQTGVSVVTLDELVDHTRLARKTLYGAVHNAVRNGALSYTGAQALYEVPNFPLRPDAAGDEAAQAVAVEVSETAAPMPPDEDIQLIMNAVQHFGEQPAAVAEFLTSQMGAERTLAASLKLVVQLAEK